MNDIAATSNSPIRFNYTNPGEHVPRAERNNRTIEERARAAYHYRPLLTYLALWLNTW